MMFSGSECVFFWIGTVGFLMLLLEECVYAQVWNLVLEFLVVLQCCVMNCRCLNEEEQDC